MNIFPAIDLVQGSAVRLTKGDYAKMKIYSSDPTAVAVGFRNGGAKYLHMVDLEGAKVGRPVNFDVICRTVAASGLKTQVGGGIREEETIRRYLEAGVFRVILGTAAVSEPGFLESMLSRYGERIAVGVDLKEGKVAIRGWTAVLDEDGFSFCRRVEALGGKTIICTDISKDGVLSGTNLPLYRKLAKETSLDLVASGGITSREDLEALRDMGLYGAILGKALYEGRLTLSEALAAGGKQT